MPRESQGRIIIATHEATANAMKHGAPDHPVTVTATHEAGDVMRVLVENEETPTWKDSRLVPHKGGRGLPMMRQLMSEVAIRNVTTVVMRADL